MGLLSVDFGFGTHILRMGDHFQDPSIKDSDILPNSSLEMPEMVLESIASVISPGLCSISS